MDKLWAPWRDTYVTKIIDKTKGCIFCKMLRENKDKKNLIFVRFKHSFAVLNLYPYSNGHSLILPLRHVNELKRLTKAESEDLWQLLVYVQDLLEKAMSAQGFNIGLNLGRIAGAGFPGHLHFHIVPRWKGDVNFMPIVGNTRIISQSLSTLYTRLSAAHKGYSGKKSTSQ